jgi:hypothetical protein
VPRLTCLVVAIAAGGAHADGGSSDETPQATPYRPSVATPAQLSAPGWLEIEAGGLRAHFVDGSKRDSIPTTFKLAFTPDWGVRVSTDAWARLTDVDGTRTSGGGDTAVILKRRFAVDDASAFGVEGSVSFPTAKTGLGSGGTDFSINGIYSVDLPHGLHADLNLEPTRLQRVDPGSSHVEWIWAASLSKTLDERWGVTIEPSGTRRQGADTTSQLLGAVTFNASRRVVLDAGLARSLRHGDREHSAFAGVTWLAAHL